VVGSDVGAANLARADAGEESGDLVQRWQSTVNIANEMGMYTNSAISISTNKELV
jgi:hypothetical protein